MFLAFLTISIFSKPDISDQQFKNAYLLDDEPICTYDILYNNTVISNSAICLVRCTFKSIKSTDGGAVVVSLRNRFGLKNIFINCTFLQCQSDNGGAIYLNIEKNSNTTIINSLFSNNLAQKIGGAIIAISKIECYLEIRNSIFNNNSAKFYAGSIYYSNISYNIDNCQFCGNSINSGIVTDPILNGGSVFCLDSNGSFINCNFDNNNAISKWSDVYGGAVSIRDSNGYFIGCTFTNNKADCQNSITGHQSFGGSISFMCYKKDSIWKFNNCTFQNNTVYSTSKNANGGSICSYIVKFDVILFSFVFEDVIFISNSAYSSVGSNGGAIFFLNTNRYSVINSSFYRTSFINNYGNLKSTGGAIYFSNEEKNTKSKFFFSDSIFNNNTANSQKSSSLGGAIYLNQIRGSIQNCTFTNNMAKTFSGEYLISGTEPRSMGGAVYLNKSNIDFIKSTFNNNTGFGEAPKHVSTGQGGAICAEDSISSLFNCIFFNNTLVNYGNKFDIDCYTEGGACYFSNSNAAVTDCNFFNNSAIIYPSEYSSYFSARIYGGALYSHCVKHSLNCTNCVFIDNLVLISDNKEKEFAGAVYLTNGTFDSCIFKDNSAYNGGDIRYDQILNSRLTIKKCSFQYGLSKKHEIKSLIHIRTSSNISLPNLFTENKVAININSYLFDGEIEQSPSTLKFKFNQNCMSPFNEAFYKTEELLLFDENGLNKETFNNAFQSDCGDFIISQTIPIITETQEIKTQTPTITLAPTKSKTQTPSKTLIPTKTKTQTPTKTRSMTFTPTKSISLAPTATYIPSATKTKTPMPTKTMITHTEEIKTPSQSIPIVTHTEPIITITKDIETPTQSLPVIDDNTNQKSKNDKKEMHIICIFLIGNMLLQIILIVMIFVLIATIKSKKKKETDIIDRSLLDSLA